MAKRGGKIFQILFATFLFLGFFVFFANNVQSATSPYINTQLRLRNSSAQPVTTTVTVQFSIYGDPASGADTDLASVSGSLLWKETYDGSLGCSQITPDSQGYFSVELGSCINFPAYLDFNTTSLWLGVKVGADAELTPRLRINSHPFAFNSERVSGLYASSTATANQLLALESNLNFNINTGAYMGATFVMSSSTATSSIVGNFTVQGLSNFATTSVTALNATSLSVNTGATQDIAMLTLQNTAGDIQFFQSTANPESLITGNIGDLAIDSTNGDLFIKKTDATSTGWSMFLTSDDLASSTAFMLGGNRFEQDAVLGSNDNFNLVFQTNSTTAVTIDTFQNVTFVGSVAVSDTSTLATTTATDFSVSGQSDFGEITVLSTSTFNGSLLVHNGIFISSTTPLSVADTLYNLGGKLYWNGELLSGLATSSVSSSSTGGVFVGFTADITDGDFGNGLAHSGSKIGYQAANSACNFEYDGAHFCQTNEIIGSIYSLTDLIGFNNDAWMAQGPPGYTANSNDCNGYTLNAGGAFLGAYWSFDANGGGMGWLINCTTELPLACCR